MHPLPRKEKEEKKSTTFKGGLRRCTESAPQARWLLTTGIGGGEVEWGNWGGGTEGGVVMDNMAGVTWYEVRGASLLTRNQKLQAGEGMYRLRRRAAFRSTKPSGRMEARSLRRTDPVRFFQARIRRRSTCLAVEECDFRWGLDWFGMMRDGIDV
jgi:hypothetical protein